MPLCVRAEPHATAGIRAVMAVRPSAAHDSEMSRHRSANVRGELAGGVEPSARLSGLVNLRACLAQVQSRLTSSFGAVLRSCGEQLPRMKGLGRSRHAPHPQA